MHGQKWTALNNKRQISVRLDRFEKNRQIGKEWIDLERMDRVEKNVQI